MLSIKGLCWMSAIGRGEMGFFRFLTIILYPAPILEKIKADLKHCIIR